MYKVREKILKTILKICKTGDGRVVKCKNLVGGRA